MIISERYIDPVFKDFDQMTQRANSFYKRSRQESGQNDVRSRFLAESSAWFGEQAFNLSNGVAQSFVVNVIARDVVSAYFTAGLHEDVLRFARVAINGVNNPLFTKSLEPYVKVASQELGQPVITRTILSSGAKGSVSKSLL